MSIHTSSVTLTLKTQYSLMLAMKTFLSVLQF